MPLTIGSNIASLKAQRQLGRSSDALSSVYERLSSGQRINRASDDPAGLAVATALDVKARIYTTAQRNVSDTISAVSIASDAVSSLTEITTRQKELAEQAASGSYSSKQRQALDKESRELTNEYNRIVSTTQFNGIKLLDNPWDTLSTQLGIGNQASIGFKFADELSTKLTPGSYFLLDGVEDYYVWFTVDGVGTDPHALGDNGVRVDLFSNNTPYAATGPAVNLSVQSGAAYSQNGPGDSFYVLLAGRQFNVWFNVDGTNSDPSDPDRIGGASLEVDITSSMSSAQVAEAVKTAIVSGGLDAVTNGQGQVLITDSTPGVYTGPTSYSLTSNVNILSTSTGSDASVGGSSLDPDAIRKRVADALTPLGFYVSYGTARGELRVTSPVTGKAISSADGNSGIVVVDTMDSGSGSELYTLTSASLSDTKYADVNRDGFLDVVASSFSATYVLLNQGNGTFAPPLTAQGGLSNLTLADINNDGNIDILGVMSGNQIAMSLGRGDGTFGPRSTIGLSAGPNVAIQTGDLDRDGDQDLVTVNATTGVVSVFSNTGSGSFASAVTYATGAGSVIDARVMDFNNDGASDLIVTTGGGGRYSIFLNNGSGTFSSVTSYTTNAAPGQVGFADLNNDGRLDLFAGSNFNLGAATRYFLPDGTTGSEFFQDFGGGVVGSAVAGDLNGDGRTDIVAGILDTVGGVTGNSVSIRLSTGAFTYGAPITFLTGVDGSPKLRDLNGDGTLDIYVEDNSSGEVQVLLNNAHGSFSPPKSYTLVPHTTSKVAALDLNGDGKPEIIGPELNEGAIAVLTNQGNGTFGPLAGSETKATVRLLFGDARGMTEVNQIDLTTQFLAKKAMPALDARLERLGKQQGAFGAIQSRLETASRVVSTTALNYRSAESRIKDTDIAQDATEQTRLAIVQRAATAVLAQANLQPQIALMLLRS